MCADAPWFSHNYSVSAKMCCVVNIFQNLICCYICIISGTQFHTAIWNLGHWVLEFKNKIYKQTGLHWTVLHFFIGHKILNLWFVILLTLKFHVVCCKKIISQLTLPRPAQEPVSVPEWTLRVVEMILPPRCVVVPDTPSPGTLTHIARKQIQNIIGKT